MNEPSDTTPAPPASSTSLPSTEAPIRTLTKAKAEIQAILAEMQKVMDAGAMPRKEELSEEDSVLWRSFAMVVEVLEKIELESEGVGGKRGRETMERRGDDL